MPEFAITHHIPVSNHVYKFILKRYGTDHIRATRYSFIGNLIISLHNRNDDIKLNRKTGFKRKIKITVPFHIYDKNGVHITRKSAQLFNTQIDYIFREELFAHALIANDSHGEMYTTSIRNFLKAYDITEEDIKLETLLRDFNRKKQRYDLDLVEE